MLYRKVELSDLEEIASIEKDVMSMPWSYESFLEAAESDHTLFIVADDNGKIAGFAVFYITSPEAELPDIVVSKEYRRQGVGRQLLRTSIDTLVEQGITDIFLEVREHNEPARLLYKSFEFVETGLRKNFYENPVENAICMHLECK